MQLLASIHPEDVDPESPHCDYETFRLRPAGRAIIFDGNKVALIHVRKSGYYMLPGGGIEDEDTATALAREIKEEIGCEVAIGKEIGSIELYFDRWKNKQIDHCYIAQKVGNGGETSLTEFEEAEGYQVVWANSLTEAIKLVEELMPEARDGKLVRARDLLFLQTAAGH